MKKSLIVALSSWSVVGFFYVLYKLEIHSTLVGVFQELLIIPAVLSGTVFSILFLYKLRKKLSTTKKVIIITVVLGFLVNLIGGGKPDPCDCTSVMSKRSYVGFEGLSDSKQVLYNKCAKSYWNMAAANRQCKNKVLNNFNN